MRNPVLEFIKSHIYIILGIVCVVAIGLIYIFSRLQPSRQILPQDIIYNPSAAAEEPAAEPAPEPVAETAQVPVEEPRTIVVHIIGEVQNPGVLTLPYGSRVDDAVQMAGGGTVYANLAAVNLAAFLRDAMQIRIPAFGEDSYDLIIYDETAASAAAQAPGISAGGLVNVNTASLAELQTLPRVGPVMAQRIVDFREAHGNFATVDELINVTGIGAATLAGLRDLVTVGD